MTLLKIKYDFGWIKKQGFSTLSDCKEFVSQMNNFCYHWDINSQQCNLVEKFCLWKGKRYGTIKET
jgi:hypothetical protein